MTGRPKRFVRTMFLSLAIAGGAALLAAPPTGARSVRAAQGTFVVSIRATQTTTWSVPHAVTAILAPQWIPDGGPSCIQWVAAGSGRQVASFSASSGRVDPMKSAGP